MICCSQLFPVFPLYLKMFQTRKQKENLSPGKGKGVSWLFLAALGLPVLNSKLVIKAVSNDVKDMWHKGFCVQLTGVDTMEWN